MRRATYSEPLSFLWPIGMILLVTGATFYMNALLPGLVLILAVLGLFFVLRAGGSKPGSGMLLVGATVVLLTVTAFVRGATLQLPDPTGMPAELTTLPETSGGSIVLGSDSYLVFYNPGGETRLHIELPQFYTLRARWAFYNAYVTTRGSLVGDFFSNPASKPAEWGDRIRANIATENNEPVIPSFNFALPLEAKHRHTWVELTANMDLFYPYLIDDRTFDEATTPVSRQVRLFIGGPEDAGYRQAVNEYNGIRNTLDNLPGTYGMMGLFALGGVLLVAGVYMVYIRTYEPPPQPVREVMKGKSKSIRESSGMSKSLGLKDGIHSLLIGLVLTAVFVAIAVGVSFAIGVPRSSEESSLVQGTGGSGIVPTQAVSGGDPGTQPTSVASAPTVEPTATEIPCEAQVWWDGQKVAFNQVYNDLTTLSVDTPANNPVVRDNFQSWRAAFESAPFPPCVQSARDAIAAAIPSAEAFINLYLSVSTDQQRGAGFIQMANSLLAASDQLIALGVTSLETAAPEEAWIPDIQGFMRAECPAERWMLESLAAPGYFRFFDLLRDFDPNSSLTDIQGVLVELRTLDSALRTDSASFPECVKPASDRLLGAMNAFIQDINSILNGDMNLANQYYATALSEFSAFQTELVALDPDIAEAFGQ